MSQSGKKEIKNQRDQANRKDIRKYRSLKTVCEFLTRSEIEREAVRLVGKVESRTVYVLLKKVVVIGVPVRDPVDSSS